MGGNKTKLDLEQLRQEIRDLNYNKELYAVLREELTKLGHWKQLKRGKPNPTFTKR
jgi:protein associated with RNAse G/E